MHDVYIFVGQTQAQWQEENPILDVGERAYERDTGQVKIGDGVSFWIELDYYVVPPVTIPTVITSYIAAQALNHINDLTPHPAYDDAPSLVLLYQNAKV